MQITTELNWQKSSALPATAALREWILHPGSFMQRLEQHGAINPQVQVLQQTWQIPIADERTSLQMRSGIEALVREVLIFSKGKTWMFARTVFPREVLAIEPQLENLQERSLGSVLFKDPTMHRSEFEVANVYAGSTWYQVIMQQVLINQPMIWARRSQFFLQEQPLLLTEMFLPDIEKLIPFAHEF